MTDTADLLRFVAAAPTPYHAVQATSERLRAAGFTRIEEADEWALAAGDRRYVVRGGSSIVAFVAGSAPSATGGFVMIGAHTDSPNLRVKPSADVMQHGYRQVGVEVYGGVLLSTWTDRDLGVAGRIVARGADGEIATRLLRVDRPIARIPQLAIHLDREVNDRGLVLNKETHMRPVFGLGTQPAFLEWLANELHVTTEAILGFDLMLHDLQAPSIGGLDEEFVFSPRLDNLASCHAATSALTATAAERHAWTRVITLHDHEEVGSASVEGASGSFLGDVIERISAATSPEAGSFQRAKARSLLVSADMAHAIHPNYAEKHDVRHAPKIGGGPVIKINSNMRYATNAVTQARFAAFCQSAEVPYQRFVMRSDMACGSTIGPLIATRLGVPTVDVGNPMLSMHSCREMAGTRDHESMIRALAMALASDPNS